jgi:hypothetical protein
MSQTLQTVRVSEREHRDKRLIASEMTPQKALGTIAAENGA